MYLWGSSPQGNTFFTKKHRSVLHYYKNPKPSEIKVCIIFPSSGTLELWKFSNLTFGGYLAGITLILSVRSSSSLLRRFCLEHVRIVWLTDDFWHHQLVPSVGNSNEKAIAAILTLLRQRVVWYSLARWQPTTIPKISHTLLPLRDRYRP